jgi:uncharacterized protein involved in exopolysaccharide biosynthesis
LGRRGSWPAATEPPNAQLPQNISLSIITIGTGTAASISSRGRDRLSATARQSQPEGDISFAELVRIVSNAKVLIFCVALATTIASTLAAFYVPKEYQATVVVSPVEENSSSQLGALSSLASQFSGLTSIGGLSLTEGSSKRNESVAVLQSESLTERYIEKTNLLPILFREKWDAAKGGWKATAPNEVPTLWKGNMYFKKKVRSLTSDSRTGLVTLKITWKDPQLAAQWANDLVRETNSYLQGVAIAEAERNIAYLREQIAKSDLVSVREAMSSVLQNQINDEVLARGRDQYALKIIDPAVPPEQPEWPKKVPWIATGFFVGLLGSTFGAILRKALQ